MSWRETVAGTVGMGRLVARLPIRDPEANVGQLVIEAHAALGEQLETGRLTPAGRPQVRVDTARREVVATIEVRLPDEAAVQVLDERPARWECPACGAQLAPIGEDDLPTRQTPQPTPKQRTRSQSRSRAMRGAA